MGSFRDSGANDLGNSRNLNEDAVFVQPRMSRFAQRYQKVSNWYAEKLQGNVRICSFFASRSIQRDIENKHGVTLGLIDVTAAKTQQF